MAVQTSQVTTASNGNLQLNPDGNGKVRLNKLAGSSNLPVGVDNNGDTKHFKLTELTVKATPVGTDEVMIQSGADVLKCTLTALVTAGGGGGGGGGITLTDLSAVTGSPAVAGGSFAYSNTTGAFTYTPSLTYAAGSALDLTGSTFSVKITALSDR